MNGKNEFVRLNVRQRAFLDAIKVWDDDPKFFDKLSKGSVSVLGMPESKVRMMAYELDDAGYLKLLFTELNGRAKGLDPLGFTLSSDAFCYRHEYCVNLVLPVLLQLLGGVSGGLAVWLLTRVFGG